MKLLLCLKRLSACDVLPGLLHPFSLACRYIRAVVLLNHHPKDVLRLVVCELVAFDKAPNPLAHTVVVIGLLRNLCVTGAGFAALLNGTVLLDKFVERPPGRIAEFVPAEVPALAQWDDVPVVVIGDGISRLDEVRVERYRVRSGTRAAVTHVADDAPIVPGRFVSRRKLVRADCLSLREKLGRNVLAVLVTHAHLFESCAIFVPVGIVHKELTNIGLRSEQVLESLVELVRVVEVVLGRERNALRASLRSRGAFGVKRFVDGVRRDGRSVLIVWVIGDFDSVQRDSLRGVELYLIPLVAICIVFVCVVELYEQVKNSSGERVVDAVVDVLCVPANESCRLALCRVGERRELCAVCEDVASVGVAERPVVFTAFAVFRIRVPFVVHVVRLGKQVHATANALRDSISELLEDRHLITVRQRLCFQVFSRVALCVLRSSCCINVCCGEHTGTTELFHVNLSP